MRCELLRARWGVECAGLSRLALVGRFSPFFLSA